MELDWCNFWATVSLGLLTAILSALLIFFNVRVSKKQNKLQKQINDNQIQLQKKLAEKDGQVAMYQYRMKCYMQVMQALDIVCYPKLEDTIDIFKTENISIVLKKISDGRDLLFRAYVESEALFYEDEEVVSLIKNIYHNYDELYCIACNMIAIPNEEFEKRSVLLLNKMGIKQPSDMCLKYIEFSKSANYFDDYVEIYPEQKEYYLTLKVLKQYYGPNNKLYQLVKKYLPIENL